WALSQLLLAVFPRELAYALLILAGAAALVIFWRDLPPAWTARPAVWIGRAMALLKPNAADCAVERPAARAAPPTALSPERPATLPTAAGRDVVAGWNALRSKIGRALAALLPAPTEGPATPAGRARGAPATDHAPQAPRPAARSSASEPRRPATATKAEPKPPSRPAAPSPSAGSDEGRAPRGKARPDHLPPISLLRSESNNRNNQADVRQRAQLLKQTLAEFGVPVEIVSIKEGPTVTQFGLEPGEIVRELRNGEVLRRRVSVHRIQQLSNDLALALAAASIRIEAPVPGRPYVGVEIPNTSKTLVTLRGLLESPEFARVRSPLAAALGRDVAGDPVIIDLARLPHLLIAGATGSGKSVCINAIISSLLMNNGPERVRFLMVDPKMVELPIYNGIPHLLGPVITDVSQVPAALAWLTLQMDDRYRLFAERGVRNIEEYNRKVGRGRSTEILPYLILVIDELADLMMTAAYDVERQICRLAQMARATGIHLVLATQRPSVDVITGLIKANFPARIAFAVTSQVDSRVILDTPGAEKLLGRGDMLYMAPDSARLARIQGCFVSDEEIEAIVGFWKQQAGADDPTDGEPAAAPWA
ncbi:MAG: DNA translocase FtsK, partial [Anaerolineae bacterium]